MFNRFLHQTQIPNVLLEDFYRVPIEEADNLSSSGWSLTSNANANDTVPLHAVLRGDQVNLRTSIISLVNSLHDFINFSIVHNTISLKPTEGVKPPPCADH